jgi:WD40 repeat protein
VLTASRDKTARLWDTASGRELQVLRGHEDEVTSAQFSADGKSMLTASDDQTARLWRCDVCRPVDEIGAELAKAVGRELSQEERRQFGMQEAEGVTFLSLFSIFSR